MHGSLAMGSYYRPKSDIDLIVVVSEELGKDLSKELGIAIARHAEKRPTTGSVELSVITKKVAKQAPMPTPFELHYSSDWHEKILNGDVNYDSSKTDTDLGSHFMYVQQRGICLFGKPINEVFGEYDWRHFIDAVIDDFDWILEDEHILETPFYAVLNICRVLQLFNENSRTVHSKDEGGEWALKNLPTKYHPVIQKSLDVYRSENDVSEDQRRTGGLTWQNQELLSLRDYAIEAKKEWKQ